MILLIALISSVPSRGTTVVLLRLRLDQATATGMSYLFRSIGSMVGVTASQCVLQNLLKLWLTRRIQGPNAQWVIHLVVTLNLDYHES
jgi:hypothetical protein